MNEIAIVRAAFGNRDEASRVARLLVGERLAACAELTAIASVYRWQGAVEQAEETVLTAKTTSALAALAAARIDDLHGYDLPVIERWAVTVDDAIYGWIRANTLDQVP